MLSRQSAYAHVLARPGVRRTFSLSLVGRSAYALVFLPLFYAAERATSSIAFAGVVIAAYGAGASFLAPARAWCIDRFGARRVLSILIVMFGAVLAAIALVSFGSGPAWAMLGLAAVAGSVAPPLGPTMRVAWAALLPNAEGLKKGLSLDSAVEELLYLAGPALAGFALTLMSPGYALLIPAGLVIVGGLVFTRTDAVASMPSGVAHRHPDGKRVRSLVLDRRFVALLIPALVAGGIAGMVSVTIPAAVTEMSGTGMVGIALGLFAGGSAVGGLLYGALKVPGSPSTQLLTIGTALVVIASLVALTDNGIWLSVILGFAGLFFSPVMIVAYMAAHTAAAGRRQNAATTWVNTSHNLGSTVIIAVAGILIQYTSVPISTVVIGAVSLLLLAVAGALGSRRGHATPADVSDASLPPGRGLRDVD